MEEKKIRVAITHGDTNGIGYEVILKAFNSPMMLDLCTPVIYGSAKVAARHRKALKLETQYTVISNAEEARDGRLNLLDTFDDDVEVELGTPTEASDAAAHKAVDRAKEDLQQGLYDVLVQAPVQTGNAPAKEEKALTVMVTDLVRIGLATTRMSKEEAQQAITAEKIADRARIFHTSLRRDFSISTPRVAILALNPQPGEEDKNMVAAAIETLEKEDIQAFGPYAADDFFEQQMYYQFDGVLAMYEDQAQTYFKPLAFDYGVKLKTGISLVCTAPDQGPAFDIAGKGEANELSMRHAIYIAIDMLRNRKRYDEPMGHPLPKLYHEKREDGEKARFAVRIPPKKSATAETDEEKEE